MRGLYIHIPFCKHICSYCDFPKMVSFSKEKMDKYVNNLILELNSYKKELATVNTVFIGGGTPNALPLDLLLKLLNAIRSNLDSNNIIEFCIECNPELLTTSQVKLFKEFNITRVSLGAESFNDEVLKKLGRHHKKSDIINAVNLLRENGTNNININLIFGHPFDTINLVKENLNNFYGLNIPHISYYSMILEDHTIFKYQYDKKIIELPDEDIVADMYEYIMQDLNNHGYNQYEISNFAKNGYESVHNQIYWNLDDYIGIGLGASGFINNNRYTNAFTFEDYFNNKKDVNSLDKYTQEQEFMMLGFRLIKGPSKLRFKEKFNEDIKDVFKDEINRLINKKLIKETENNYCLTHEGIMLGNEVFMEFVNEN